MAEPESALSTSWSRSLSNCPCRRLPCCVPDGSTLVVRGGWSRDSISAALPQGETMPRLNVAIRIELIAGKRAELADDMLSVVANATIDDPTWRAGGCPDAELYTCSSIYSFSRRGKPPVTHCRQPLALVITLTNRVAIELLPTAIEEIRGRRRHPPKRRTKTNQDSLCLAVTVV